jgi:Spy/CpxP family protein refolding chaperone
MNSIRFRFLLAALAVVLATTLAQSQTSDAAPPPPMHGPDGFGMHHMLDYFTKALNLTQDQQTQAKATIQKEMPTLKPLFQQEHQIQLQLRQYAEGTYDAAKVQALAQQKAQIQAQLTVQETRVHNELYQLLTPDQQTQLKQLQATHEARWQKHMQEAAPPPPEE